MKLTTPLNTFSYFLVFIDSVFFQIYKKIDIIIFEKNYLQGKTCFKYRFLLYNFLKNISRKIQIVF